MIGETLKVGNLGLPQPNMSLCLTDIEDRLAVVLLAKLLRFFILVFDLP